MKKYFLSLALTIIMISISFSCYAAELVNEDVKAIINKEVSIVYNDELKAFFDVNGSSVNPITYNDTTYLPIRSISALFSIPVEWDGANNKILLGKGDMVSTTAQTIEKFTKGTNEEIELLLNKNLEIEYKNEVQEFKDANGVTVYPLSYNGTTYLPVRAISNIYGASVEWNEVNKQITLSLGDRVAQITDVIIKVVNNTLCTEIKTDMPLLNYTETLLGEGRVLAEPYLNMRASANTNAEILDKIPQDTVITVKKVIIGDNSDKWYQVSYGNKMGYVSANYVNINSARLLIDLENTQFAAQTSSQEINYSKIKSIRFGAQGNNINRIVLDLNDVTEYQVTQSKDKYTTYLALSNKFEIKENQTEKDYVLVASIGNQVFIPEIEKPVETPEQKPVQNPVESNNSGEVIDKTQENNNSQNSNDEKEEIKQEPIKELTEAQKAKMTKVTGVLYSSSTDTTKINLTGNYDFEKFLLENPNRLVIDIKNALLEVDGPKEIVPKNKNIKAIRFSQYEIDKVRIVFEFAKAVDYGIVQKLKGIEVKIAEPEYRNIEYNLQKDYSELILRDVSKKVFDVSETTRTNKITITYASSKFDSGKSTLDIYDDFVKKIEIKTNKITITGSQKISYEMTQKGNDVVIKIFEKGKEISKKDDDEDFLVLLDAGHGGSDPGACRGATNEEKHLPENQEKNYNLTVMKMVQEMLEDTEGIRVEVSRSKDVYMDREDRVDFILDNSEADLLVSVHVNSHATNKPNGLEVVYCNKPNEKEDYGITSKELALILLEHFENELDINMRGLSGRNGEELWILEQNATGAISNYTKEDRPVTNIPAVICELCFITNDVDFEQLITDEFQKNAAKAIYEGILEAKEQMQG